VVIFGHLMTREKKAYDFPNDRFGEKPKVAIFQRIFFNSPYLDHI
jgi:hypothetical protein